MKKAGESPVCIKVDTEGYEYHLIDQFRLLDPRRIKAIQVQMHPTFYAQSLKGQALSRRIRTSIATWRVARSLRGFMLANRKMLLWLLGTSLFNKEIRFGDLVFVSKWDYAVCQNAAGGAKSEVATPPASAGLKVR